MHATPPPNDRSQTLSDRRGLRGGGLIATTTVAMREDTSPREHSPGAICGGLLWFAHVGRPGADGPRVAGPACGVAASTTLAQGGRSGGLRPRPARYVAAGCGPGNDRVNRRKGRFVALAQLALIGCR